jgi:hypothetical protein
VSVDEVDEEVLQLCQVLDDEAPVVGMVHLHRKVLFTVLVGKFTGMFYVPISKH